MNNSESLIEPLSDGALLHIFRKGKRITKLRLGPNQVHAFIRHRDGHVTDLGISENLLTNAGRDLWAAAFGHATHKAGVLTASSATSATPSGGGLTTDQYKGWRVFCPITNITTAPVYGNIGSNSTTVLTLDQWWTDTDTVGTTPASTNGYFIIPTCLPRFMAVSGETTAPAAGNTTLAGEETGGVGLNRALSTYAHTGGTATYTMQKAFSVTGSPATNPIHKMGLLTASNSTAAGVLVFSANLNADATVGNGDTLTITDTITLSG